MKRFIVALGLLCAVTESGVSAWGDDGHKIVCAIAQKILSSSDRAEVERLTRLYRTPDKLSFQFFTSACVFADTARRRARAGDPGWTQFSPFENFHFLNVPRTTTTIGAGACGGDCVLEGIRRHFDRLRNHTLGDPERAEALIFLGHWVGDAHQPLHVSFEDDRGGNLIKPISGGFYQSDHLHQVWDSGIIKAAHGTVDWFTFAGQLKASITPAQRKEWLKADSRAWAQESYDVSLTADVQYCRRTATACNAIAGGRTLSKAYQDEFADPVEVRLQKAGVRLADLIRRALH